jgi:hypothetical protein
MAIRPAYRLTGRVKRAINRQPVQAIRRHLGLDGGYLGDLLPAGLRVFARKGLPALRRHQGALLACVTGLLGNRP